MKIEKVGDLNILVPKDAEVSRTGKGGLIKVERVDEYMPRKLLELEERFEKLEKSQEELKKRINQLQNRKLISR